MTHVCIKLPLNLNIHRYLSAEHVQRVQMTGICQRLLPIAQRNGGLDLSSFVAGS